MIQGLLYVQYAYYLLGNAKLLYVQYAYYFLGNMKLIIAKLLLRKFVFYIKGIICSYIGIYL